MTVGEFWDTVRCLGVLAFALGLMWLVGRVMGDD